MREDILRHVQMEQLYILEEVDRVCKENGISYFLDSGTLIGAVRHKGFIPWDDDIDIGMLREDYEKFLSVAPYSLSNDFYFQTWKNDSNYALPFGKIRRKNTIFIEENGSASSQEGFFIDVFPFDNAPNDIYERNRLVSKRVFWARCILMKHKHRPWLSNGRINYTKWFAYLFYRFLSVFYSHEYMVSKYEKLVFSVAKSDYVYEQIGKKETHYYLYDWLDKTKLAEFEGKQFLIPEGAHERLKEEYGDYMVLPPEDKRENRHGVIKVVFSNGEVFENV